jgi:hypothetical protein
MIALAVASGGKVVPNPGEFLFATGAAGSSVPSASAATPATPMKPSLSSGGLKADHSA